MKHKVLAEIVDTREQGAYLTITARCPEISREAKPGQFVNIRVRESFDPLLRRPFGIHDADGDLLTVMVMLRGKGTRALLDKHPGDTLNLIGPLGNPYPSPHQGKPPLLIAGGIGIAPFYFFAKAYPKPVLLFGARSAELVPLMDKFREVCDPAIATDDGSEGVKGTVVDLLKEYDLSKYTIYACGPTPMFRALTEHFSSRPTAPDAYFSLETYMGCGFGACKGCSVRTKPDGAMKLCCTDGPAFKWNEVEL
ncbi:MAG: hypothetical protein A2Y33_04155 [Spirochaetes bacterium GWF1_51_8]|nr:MAG: hypothetical protein A2Y33_04155 [Spirochaetes bacterium GWF1_51_8]